MLHVEGEVAAPRRFANADLQSLPNQVADVSALVPKREGAAVWLRDVLASAGARPTARFATLASADGKFAICVPLQPLLERALLVHSLGGGELPADKGGPVRVLLTGDLKCKDDEIDKCAMVKGLGRIRVLTDREPDVGHEHH